MNKGPFGFSEEDVVACKTQTRYLAASIQEPSRFPCGLVTLVGEQHGRLQCNAYGFTATLPEDWFEHAGKVVRQLVDAAKPVFRADNGFFPAIAVVAVMSHHIPVEDVAEVIVEQLLAMEDAIVPDAAQCEICLLTFGDEPDGSPEEAYT